MILCEKENFQWPQKKKFFSNFQQLETFTDDFNDESKLIERRNSR